MKAADKEALKALECAYLMALLMPHESTIRVRRQDVLCALRDAIVAETGREAQEVQEAHEAMAFEMMR